MYQVEDALPWSDRHTHTHSHSHHINQYPSLNAAAKAIPALHLFCGGAAPIPPTRHLGANQHKATITLILTHCESDADMGLRPTYWIMLSSYCRHSCTYCLRGMAEEAWIKHFKNIWCLASQWTARREHKAQQGVSAILFYIHVFTAVAIQPALDIAWLWLLCCFTFLMDTPRWRVADVHLSNT